MANFNEVVNNYLGIFFMSESFQIHRVGKITEFECVIAGWMDEYFDPNSSSYKSKARLETMPSCFRCNRVNEMDELVECSATRELIIRYKDGHRSKKLSGRCFVWDIMEEPYCGLSGQELQKKSYRLSTVGNGFGVPRFDGVEAAVLITDREVVVYGGAMIVAAEMDVEKVRFDVLIGNVCVSDFDVDTAAFDRYFGLKENFPEQFDEFFGAAKADDKCVELESEEVSENNVWESETRKRLESAIEVVNECFDALCKSEIRDGVDGAFFTAWAYIDDAMRVYYKSLKRIDKKEEKKNEH